MFGTLAASLFLIPLKISVGFFPEHFSLSVHSCYFSPVPQFYQLAKHRVVKACVLDKGSAVFRKI